MVIGAVSQGHISVWPILSATKLIQDISKSGGRVHWLSWHMRVEHSLEIFYNDVSKSSRCNDVLLTLLNKPLG